MLLGYHLQWSSIPRVLGNDEQRERWEKTFLEANAFVGGMSILHSQLATKGVQIEKKKEILM